MAIHNRTTKSTTPSPNAKDTKDDVSLSLELVMVVGIVLIGGIAMIFVVHKTEGYRERKRQRKLPEEMNGSGGSEA
ncbi:785022b6-97ce-4922-922e-8de0fcf92e65-CDS [Sclerotinia trifoliorum]|uniref:785022b6-97ce-4922-922e-8de0fcf92e65-CDS n=1 Tax=Sclerotinia trifoliorum TaxID=28548 RepID=A0A8H2ZTH1_9HELO|nr:785022b6-97ce-4922-922e-8de0fcf92e65-CDS [Sclerotinia trifoliorum]